ncbi:peroxiredoxin [Desulfovibrio desulfuricans]|uniref:Alkyl hydroperoxide reductase C n=3 Tax=Desulfovibrio TaxID=872 RepID=A0AA94L3M9_DESDE|nr:peroxiredoxin [Desulfovibrio desulfuricans]SPD34637.1 peroxiredoxin [Desulfovibrio sp. G11]
MPRKTKREFFEPVMLKCSDNASLLVTHFQTKSNELQEPVTGLNPGNPYSVKALPLCFPFASLYIRFKIKEYSHSFFHWLHWIFTTDLTFLLGLNTVFKQNDSQPFPEPYARSACKENNMANLINSKVEPFNVQAYHLGELKNVCDTDLLGHWSIFFFYPADFTFVCPTELEDLSDTYEDFKKLNCEIYSVSTDSAFVHKAWADASPSIAKIRYPMLSDSAGTLSRAFHVLIEEAGQALRGSFIVNPEGIIKAYEVHDLGIGRNAEELLRKLEAAQFVAQHGDQVCPARWKPGKSTLKPGLDLVGKL